MKCFYQFSTCEIAFGNVPANWIVKSQNLKWIQLESARIDLYLSIFPSVKNKVILTNRHSFMGQPVVESTLARILPLQRGKNIGQF